MEANFLRVLQDSPAGDPRREEVRWTNLTLREMGEGLAVAGTAGSRVVVKALLRKHPEVRRKAPKAQPMGQPPERNAQFEHLAQLKQAYGESENPSVSLDTKKKELLGNFSRPGQLYTLAVVKTFDHDFPRAAEGLVIPHGVYDRKRNHGQVTLGLRHDPSEVACDSLRRWWERQGPAASPQATSVLLLCEGGGSNRASQDLFKADLQRLADELDLEIRVAHSPPYTSKYNPIEPRLFPHLTRACQGVTFPTSEVVKELMEKAKTKTGLRVTVAILDKVDQTGRKGAARFKQNRPIVFDPLLPKWNYRAVPSST